MITGQIIQNSIDELKMITKVDLCIFDLDGIELASTFEKIDLAINLIRDFADSPADSQIISGYHLMKVLDEGEVQYVLVAKGYYEDVSMLAKVAVCQLQNLIVAYKEKFDRNVFFQNLILDNLLLVDIYNRARKLHINVETPRIVFLIETKAEKDNDSVETCQDYEP